MLIERTKELVEAHFVAANGYPADAKVIYGDTDSVMINFHVGDSIEHAFHLGREAAALATKHFPAPIKLEFEKVYCPYMLFSKKRYAGLLYSSNAASPDYTDVKGFQSVRRDNCLLLRETLDQCLHLLLHQRDVAGAVDVVQEMLRTLLSRNTPLHKLILTKQLRKVTYKITPPHLALVKRLQARDATSAPVVGDRIPYVVVETRVQTTTDVARSESVSTAAGPAATESISASRVKGVVSPDVSSRVPPRPGSVGGPTAVVSAVPPRAAPARKMNAKVSGDNIEDPLYVRFAVVCFEGPFFVEFTVCVCVCVCSLFRRPIFC
jgi:hypothetical protein